MLLKTLKFLAVFDQTEPGADAHHKYLDLVTRQESTTVPTVVFIRFFIGTKLPLSGPDPE